MAPPVPPPKREEVRPPGLARWMVKHSLRAKVRDEGLAAFEDEFAEEYARSGDKQEVRIWALRVGLDSLHRAYQPLFQIGTYVLALLGFVLAVIGLLMM